MVMSNAESNAERMKLYAANADVLDGVRWLATLNTRTCPVCGELDGKIWKTSEIKNIKRPPLHKGCRCILIPYINLGDTDSARAAEVTDFEKLAAERYDKKQIEKGSSKRFKDLSDSTKKKLRYDEIKEWTKQGKQPYWQVKGNYVEYIKKFPVDEQRRILGEKYFEKLQNGTFGK